MEASVNAKTLEFCLEISRRLSMTRAYRIRRN